jgi:hypothetical protein
MAIKNHTYNESKKLYDFMLIKAGLLAEGIYFSDELLSKLRKEQKVTEGTGLFRYGDQKTAPNEISLIIGEEAHRVEVRQKNNHELTNFSINQEGDAIRLEDKLSGSSFQVDFFFRIFTKMRIPITAPGIATKNKTYSLIPAK